LQADGGAQNGSLTYAGPSTTSLMPGGALSFRVTGRNTPAVTKHYVADVDDKHRLLFVPDGAR
jgi:hypothetical protein